jgi:hypothetical protein
MHRDTLIALSITALVLAFLFIENAPNTAESPGAATPKAQFSAQYGTPNLDGNADDPIWQQSPWHPLDQTWLGDPPSPQDCSGRYKIAWDENNLYLLAEIQDEALVDTHPDGLQRYWDDDCLEIFLDEDASGGNHQYSYNAFAYHIALDGRVVDIRPDSSFAYFDAHCTTRRVSQGGQSTWEVAIRVFDGNRYADAGENIPKNLRSGKKMGFALAYCDNDNSPERENFIGSVPVPGPDKNRGWIDADIFGLLTLD